MRTYHFFYEINGRQVLFNLPEGRDWAEADGDPSLTVEVLDGDDETLILSDGTQVDIIRKEGGR